MNNLRQMLTDYLAMRRSLGFKLRDAGAELADFISFLDSRAASYISIALALEWAQMPKGVQANYWMRRLDHVRGFAKYSSAMDSRTEVPSRELLRYRYARPKPHIYTDGEVVKLLNSALRMPGRTEFKKRTIHCLLGLLAVSGLRISEAINLKTKDVDLQEGILTVESSKFGRSRLVPLHASTVNALALYASWRNAFLDGRSTSFYFFVSEAGTRLCGNNFRRAFYELLKQAGVPEVNSKRRPRLHDFRHTFAVKTLLRWYQTGENVEARLPMLSTLLGHVTVQDTYWYLTVCPELMSETVDCFERWWEAAR
jgi:integrase